MAISTLKEIDESAKLHDHFDSPSLGHECGSIIGKEVVGKFIPLRQRIGEQRLYLGWDLDLGSRLSDQPPESLRVKAGEKRIELCPRYGEAVGVERGDKVDKPLLEHLR